MEGILRRLHVQPSVIKEAAAAVKLGLATPEALENVAKRASILALEAEDRTLGGGSKAAGAPKKVWQPFPSKQGDPANHALMWRKVPVTTLPTLQPLPGSSEAEHSNFRLLPGLHAHIEAQREPWVARACFRCDCDCPVVGVGLTHDHTFDQCFDCDCLLSGSAGKEFMQFDGGIYRVLNTTGDILPGAIELPHAKECEGTGAGASVAGGCILSNVLSQKQGCVVPSTHSRSSRAARRLPTVC